MRLEWELCMAAGLVMLATSAVLAAEGKGPILETGDVYYIGQHIPVAAGGEQSRTVEGEATEVAYKLEWVLVDETNIIGETYTGAGPVRQVEGVGRVAFLPTGMVAKKGVYYLSA